MTIRFPDARARAMLANLVAAADAGSGPGTLTVYTGAQPASANDAATGTVLLTYTLADPAFEVPGSGRAVTLDADPDITVNASADGTPGWARVRDSDGNTVFDGSVGTSGTDFLISSTPVTNGQPVALTAGSLSY